MVGGGVCVLSGMSWGQNLGQRGGAPPPGKHSLITDDTLDHPLAWGACKR